MADDWNEHRLLVMDALKRIEIDIHEIKEEVGSLKVRSAIIGGLGGFVVGLLPSALTVLGAFNG